MITRRDVTVAFICVTTTATLALLAQPSKPAEIHSRVFDWAALKVERTRIAVWDDEGAWRANSADTASDGFIEHKRALYLKDPSSPDPVERFLVFGKGGSVVYERDFRSYPLTELD